MIIQPLSETAEPTPPKDRLVGLDVLRGFALFGVLLTNAFVSARPIEVAIEPRGEIVGEVIAWAVFDVLLVSKFVTLFSLLFGIGLVLQNQRAESKGMPFARIYRRRLSILAVFGILHGCLLFEGDILFVYAVVGAVLFLFRDLSAKPLVAIAAVPFSIGMILSFGWAWFDLKTVLAGLENTLADPPPARPETLLRLLATRPVEFLGWLVISSFISFNWRVVAFFFLGAAIMKSHLVIPTRVRLHRNVGWIGLCLGGCLELLSAYSLWSDVHPARATRLLIACCDEIGSVLLSFGFAGMILWLVHSRRLAWLQHALAAVGRTALTNYLLQSVVMNIVFGSFLLDQYNKLSRPEVLIWFSAVFATQMVVSTVWLRFKQMGPVESIWRSLTYRQL